MCACVSVCVSRTEEWRLQTISLFQHSPDKGGGQGRKHGCLCLGRGKAISINPWNLEEKRGEWDGMNAAHSIMTGLKE